jgi:signal transduction histidine kinase
MDELLYRAPCGFVSFTDDGKMVHVNATIAELIGETNPEALQGRHIESLLTPGGRLLYQTQLFPLLKLRGGLDEIYLSLRARDGSDVPVLTNMVRREHSAGYLNHAVFLQMRQRLRLEDEMLAAKRAAEEASQAKGRSVSVVSHELRTPLGAIHGFADIMLLGLHGPITEAQREDLNRIKRASQYLLTLMNDILSFSGFDAGNIDIRLATIALDEALSTAESMILLRIEEAGLIYERHQCGRDLAVRADPNRLQQILLNLLTNATKFTGRGGYISIRCERAGDVIYIHVADTGAGIPPEQRERIFDPFVQLDERRRVGTAAGGIGLGLAISRELARAMGGDITVDSTIGKGSVFTVKLPAMENPNITPE